MDDVFAGNYHLTGYVKRLRKSYDKVCRELNEVLKTAITSIAITAGVAILTIATAGALAPTIAVAFVGSNFAGLSGAALTSACLAYLGGGAILGVGVGAGVGGAAGAISLVGKKNTILQSAKLMVSVREVFLNDEKDIGYSNTNTQ